MSEDKSTEETIENIKDAVEDAVDTAQEAIEDAVDAVEDAVDAAKPPLMQLREEKPLVFYGAIAAVVGLGLFMLSGDGGSATQHTQSQSAISLDKSYILKAPNSVGESSLKILKVPGSMASFDNSEDVICNAPVGTSVIARGFQDAFGKKQLFVQVEIPAEVADCRAGVKGWTLKGNLK
ncbi:MAG: hypothetical protein GQ582_06555 [Methyloprofundus sp.]|nr:hypothetical protein [Methyloprofundus sp.]